MGFFCLITLRLPSESSPLIIPLIETEWTNGRDELAEYQGGVKA
ncbi:hypothetical protein [Rubritalea tangerina]